MLIAPSSVRAMPGFLRHVRHVRHAGQCHRYEVMTDYQQRPGDARVRQAQPAHRRMPAGAE
jgi:hypothetical protein